MLVTISYNTRLHLILEINMIKRRKEQHKTYVSITLLIYILIKLNINNNYEPAILDITIGKTMPDVKNKLYNRLRSLKMDGLSCLYPVRDNEQYLVKCYFDYTFKRIEKIIEIRWSVLKLIRFTMVWSIKVFIINDVSREIFY